MVHGPTELLLTRTGKQHSLELLRRHCLRQQLPTRCHLPYQGKVTRASDMGHCVSGRQSNKCDLGPRLHKGDGLTTSHREIHESSGQASPEMRDSTITSYLLICEQRDNPGEGEMQSMVSDDTTLLNGLRHSRARYRPHADVTLPNEEPEV